MLLKNDYINYISLIIIFFLITIFLNPNFNFSIDSLKHWSTYNRDDIVFVYGTLIYNDGIEQQHLDHPSLFTFIFTSFFYKIFYFFGFLDNYSLSQLIKGQGEINLNLSKFFFVSKFVILLFSSLSLMLLYKILFFLCKNKFISFASCYLFVFSTGFIASSNRLESGLISLFLILLCLYFFLKFLHSDKKLNIFFFVLGFIFLFSAMMQKKIIYFCVPFLLISLVPVLKKNKINYINYFFFNKNLNYKFFLTIIYLVVITFISYKTLINNTFFLSRDLDFIFLIINFFGLNLMLFFYIQYYQNRNYENLLTFNIVIGVTYFVYKYFLLFFFNTPISIWSISFTNFIGHLNMFTTHEVKGALSFDTLDIYIFNLIDHLKFVFSKYLFNFSFQFLLIWFNIFLFLFYFKVLKLIEKIVICSLIFGFFFVQSIILFRYEQDTYFLNSEILLILPLVYSLRNLRFNKIIIFTIIFFITLSNFNFIQSIRYDNSQSYCNSILGNKDFPKYYKYWTKNIPLEIINNFCKDKSL